MRTFIGWFKSIKVYRMDYPGFTGYKVADWGGWVEGGYSKTRIGAYIVAWRYQYGRGLS